MTGRNYYYYDDYYDYDYDHSSSYSHGDYCYDDYGYDDDDYYYSQRTLSLPLEPAARWHDLKQAPFTLTL